MICELKFAGVLSPSTFKVSVDSGASFQICIDVLKVTRL